MTTETIFVSPKGEKIKAVSTETLAHVRLEQKERYAISMLQVSEAAAFSFAMVIRHALGTFAKDGVVSAIVGSSLAGAVVAATARHLTNAGATLRVFVLDQEALEPATKEQLTILSKLSVEVYQVRGRRGFTDVVDSFDSAHTVLWGMHGSSRDSEEVSAQFTERLNEHTVPVHTVDSPPGIDPTTGERVGTVLYASSTLSLGMVLSGLFRANTFVGRHYICDALIPATLYQAVDLSLGELFSEQPVIKITPVEEGK